MSERMVSGKTRVCCIIGTPIEHTVSPAMHNASFKEMGLDFVYAAFRVKGDELRSAIEGVRALGIRGLNVTIPHKVAVIPFLDKLDPIAEMIGAVNTIVNDDEVLTGYNTDAAGFLQALLSQGVEPKRKNVTILGAGGAARAIAFILADRGAKLKILNRKAGLEGAKKLAARVKQYTMQEMEVGELEPESLKKAMADTEILVNATCVGMSPDNDKTPVPAELLKSCLLVFDIIYNPRQTRLLREAESMGGETIGGLEMLVWQGASSFKLWTGVKAPVEVMREAAGRALEE